MLIWGEGAQQLDLEVDELGKLRKLRLKLVDALVGVLSLIERVLSTHHLSLGRLVRADRAEVGVEVVAVRFELLEVAVVHLRAAAALHFAFFPSAHRFTIPLLG